MTYPTAASTIRRPICLRPAVCGHPEPDAGAVFMTRANILAINDSSDDCHAVGTVERE
jgi:hypothetical protein